MANPDIGCRHRRRPPIPGGRSRSGASEPGDRERGGPSDDTTERGGKRAWRVAALRWTGVAVDIVVTLVSRRRYFAALDAMPSTGPSYTSGNPPSTATVPTTPPTPLALAGAPLGTTAQGEGHDDQRWSSAVKS